MSERKNINNFSQSKLPYQLTTGVTATREGLEFKAWLNNAVELFKDRASLRLQVEFVNNDVLYQRITWPDAADRLRYREGEPWAYIENTISDEFEGNELLVLANGEMFNGWFHWHRNSLHRLAAILCDDAEAFQVLHWCVTNLGGGNG